MVLYLIPNRVICMEFYTDLLIVLECNVCLHTILQIGFYIYIFLYVSIYISQKKFCPEYKIFFIKFSTKELLTTCSYIQLSTIYKRRNSASFWMIEIPKVWWNLYTDR